MSTKQQLVLEMPKQSYCIEPDTLANHLALSINLDAVRAEQIKHLLADEA